MSWQEVDLAGISTKMELLPEQNFVFSLLAGAKYNQWDNQKIEVGAKVTEGDFSGRVIYFSYPDPAKQAWSPKTLKMLEQALVADGAEPIETGEDPVTYLNKRDVVGKRFVAPIVHRMVERDDSDPEPRADLRLFKVKPIAA